jgi:soluble lytic murein transglycosylase
VSTHGHSTTRVRTTKPRPRRPSRAAVRRRQVRRRRAALVIVLAAAASVLVVPTLPVFHHAVQEIRLPLRHEDIIRQQASEKGVDPALIAAVIYAESRFREGRRSAAGAEGLMQLTPATAKDIARLSGGTQFTVEDLATPQVNISYGAYYLRYLLQRYDGNETLALAAYNAGAGNVDKWIAQGGGGSLALEAIPFAETRGYVKSVLAARRDYRRTYASALGLR